MFGAKSQKHPLAAIDNVHYYETTGRGLTSGVGRNIIESPVKGVKRVKRVKRRKTQKSMDMALQQAAE